MNSSRNKIYHVVSLRELRELVRIAERSALLDVVPATKEGLGNHCIILRGYLSTGRHSISKLDGSRQVGRLTAKEQAPEFFNFKS